MVARFACLVPLFTIFLALMSLLAFLLLMRLVAFLAGLMVRPVVGMLVVIATISAAIATGVVRFVVVSGAGVVPPSVPAAVLVRT